MGIAFRDFVPNYTEKQVKMLLHSRTEATYENFDAAVRAANVWIDSSAVRIISLETVILPSLSPIDSLKSKETRLSLVSGGDITRTSNYYQFLRVWYEAR